MVKIGQTKTAPRDDRYAYPKRAKARTGDREAEGRVKDISVSGVALLIQTSVENGQFVELHIEGVGQVSGHVARVYEDGLAVQFDADAEKRRRIGKTIAKYNRLA